MVSGKTALIIAVAMDALGALIVFRSLLHHGTPMMKVVIPVTALFVASGALIVFAFRKK